jgi:hypothetical protein
MGVFGVEVGKTAIAATPCNSTTCKDSGDNAKVQKHPLLRDRDSNLNSKTPENAKRNACQATCGGAEMGVVSEFSPDLRKVIDNWETLPAEVKQTILTLVKHVRRRKNEKVC